MGPIQKEKKKGNRFYMEKNPYVGFNLRQNRFYNKNMLLEIKHITRNIIL